MRKNKKNLLLTILIITVSISGLTQSFNGRTTLGHQYAREAVRQALKDINHKPFYDTLIKDQETVVAVAEPILFKIYGKKNIVHQKPYECYLVDGYWYISGTLRKGWMGGVFEIIINSKDGKVIKLIHGK